MKQEYYYLRTHWIKTSTTTEENAFDILAIIKDSNNYIINSTTIEKINCDVLENLIGNNYREIIIKKTQQ